LRLARDSPIPSTEAEVDAASRETRYNLTVQDILDLGGGGWGRWGEAWGGMGRLEKKGRAGEAAYTHCKLFPRPNWRPETDPH